MDLKSVFQSLSWGSSKETRSGPGSTLEGTRQLRVALPRLLEKWKIRVVNDAGCGDLNWISGLNLAGIEYRGFDLRGLSGTEAARLGTMKAGVRSVNELDITSEVMPPADLIICKDVLIHLPHALALEALKLFKQAAPLLLSTSDPTVKNIDIFAGQFRPVNLMAPPFNLGEPLEKIEEPQWRRFQGLWRL